MKQKFQNLSGATRLLCIVISYILTFVFLIIVGVTKEGSTGQSVAVFLSLIGITCGIIFTVLYVKVRKEEKNSSSSGFTNTPEEQKTINEDNKSMPVKEEVEAKIKCVTFIEIDDEEYYLKYMYHENLCFCSNYEAFNTRDTVTFAQEPDNQYDKETIAIYVNEAKIGLMYKGEARDIANKCLSKKKYAIQSAVYLKDESNEKVGILIGFYDKLSNKQSFTASLIKTSKKDSLTDEKRQDQVDWLGEGDEICFQTDYESDGLIVTNEMGYELGEVSESVAEKILDAYPNLENVLARVSELSYDDNGKTKVKLKIYY